MPRNIEMASAHQSIGKKLSNKYRSPVVVAVVFHVLILGIASITMDFGVAFKVAAISLIPFWTIVVLIAARRSNSPSTVDRKVIACGYPVIVVILYLINSVLDR